MMSEKLPADSTRLDALQSAQIPPGVPSLGDPTMYPFCRPPLASLPNTTRHPTPSFPPGLYGARGASFAQNYHGHYAQGQSAVPVLESLTQNPTIPTQPSCFPEMYGSPSAYLGQDAVSVLHNFTPNPAFPPSSLSQKMSCTGGTYFAPTHQGQGTVSPPVSFTTLMSQNPTPNSTPTSPSLSPETYSTGRASFAPTYQGQCTVSPPASFIPPASQNLTANSPSTPPSLSQKLYSAGTSFIPNYQGTTFPPKSFIPPIFPVNNVSFQQPFCHFVGMPPNGTLAPFLPSAHSGAQASPAPFRWRLPMQLPSATQQQAHYQVPQDGATQSVAEMVPPQQPGSVNTVDYQANVVFQATLSPMQLPPATHLRAHYQVPQGAAEMVPPKQAGSVDGQIYQANVVSQAAPSTSSSCSRRKQLKNRSSVQRPAKPTTTKPTRKAQKTVRIRVVYRCKLCSKVVLVHRKKYHDKSKHSPEMGEYVCRICEVLQCPCTLSRKDALKRHVEGTHAEFTPLLDNKAFGLLLPRRADEQEDLGELKRAMRLLAPTMRLKA